MHSKEADRPKRSGPGLPGRTSDRDRFDGESARRILQRAAAEQQRLSNELADSYSFEELEEIAVEAGISSEALRAAVEGYGNESRSAPAGTTLRRDKRIRHRSWAVMSLMPGNWSTAVKSVVLITAGGIGFAGLLLAFPAVAEAILWALLLLLILLAVLVVLGASPF